MEVVADGFSQRTRLRRTQCSACESPAVPWCSETGHIAVFAHPIEWRCPGRRLRSGRAALGALSRLVDELVHWRKKAWRYGVP